MLSFHTLAPAKMATSPSGLPFIHSMQLAATSILDKEKPLVIDIPSVQ